MEQRKEVLSFRTTETKKNNLLELAKDHGNISMQILLDKLTDSILKKYGYTIKTEEIDI